MGQNSLYSYFWNLRKDWTVWKEMMKKHKVLIRIQGLMQKFLLDKIWCKPVMIGINSNFERNHRFLIKISQSSKDGVL